MRRTQASSSCAEVVSRSVEGRPHQGGHPDRSAPAALGAARCLRLRARTPVGAGHRHWRRPQALRAGSRRPRIAGTRRRRMVGRRRPEQSSRLSPGLHALQHARRRSIYADIDRTKAEQLGVPISRVFETLSVYMGSAFVNDFNILGRTYRVTAQADNPYRLSLRDVADLRTRNAKGDMVPIGSVATFRDTTVAYRVPRYNLYPAAEVQMALARRLFVAARASRPWRTSPPRCCRRVSASSGPRSLYRRSSPATRRPWHSGSPLCSYSYCCPRSTRAGCCRSPSSSSSRCVFSRP